MDAVRAKRLAEAAKYRLQVRLSLVRAQARRDDAEPVIAQADALRARVDAVRVAEDEVETQAAQRALAELTPDVLALQAAAGVPDYGLSVFPRWLEFALWTSPLVLIFGVLAVTFGLRRRKKEVDEATLAALDAAGED